MSPLEAIKKLELLLADVGENLAVFGIEDPEEVHAVVEAAEQFRRSVTFIIEMWRAREVEVLTAAGGRTDLGLNATMRVAPKLKEIYDHDLIGRKVIAQAIRAVMPDGEVIYVDDPEVAADRAVAMMRALYVAPGTEAKKGALKELGFETYKGALKSSTEVGKVVKVRPT